MRAAGFDEGRVEQALDQVWVWYEAHVADTDAQALAEFLPQFQQASQYIAGMREGWNPKDQVLPKPPPPLPRAAYAPTPNREANESLVGSPQRVTAQLALLQECGVRNLMLTNRGLMSPEQTRSSTADPQPRCRLCGDLPGAQERLWCSTTTNRTMPWALLYSCANGR
jgi:alkanesulfonate monooxygenase SsuD/methylene tetrahydromethanopterin reductase-like flavin-dependent oxidoreductase (luciferase family)